MDGINITPIDLCKDVVNYNTTSLCDSLLILKEEEHIFIFMIGIIMGILFVIFVYGFIKLLKKQKGKEVED